MEWSRAKSILMVAFLTINSFLGFLLWQEQARYPDGTTPVSSTEVAQAQRYLAEAGLEVTATVPREAPLLPMLRVQVYPINPHEVAQKYFADHGEVQAIRIPDSQGELLFVKGDEELTIYPHGIMSYRSQNSQGHKQPATEQEVQRWAQQYLAQQRQLGQDLRLKEIYPLPTEGTFLVRLQQMFADRPLVGSAGVEALVSSQGVEFLWQRWLEPLGPAGEKKAIIPATDALLRLEASIADNLAGESVVIDEITLGFYNKLYDAREWEAVPVWAIGTTTGQWYYINAFTGEMEL